MSQRVIYSMCCRQPGTDEHAFRRQLEMLELWLAHLRGPGQFAGRVLLLTTEHALPVEDVELIPLQEIPAQRERLFLERVLAYRRLGARRDELWMQLDLDALAVRPIDPLFAPPGDRSLWAAPSGLPALHPMQARELLLPPARLWYGLVRGWNRRLGVSACLTSCAGEHWEHLMGSWATAIRRSRDRAVPVLGDQSFLNLLYVTRRIPITPIAAELIYHVRTESGLASDAAQRAHVLHFPNPRKLEMMKERSVA